jgi:leader peptidase (prepilin peptidase) / N-methyltransferase
VLSGRSRCDGCGTRLRALELVPLASWLALRGRCRHCGAPIDPLHPAIEAGCLVLAALAGVVFTGWMLALACVLGWLLLTLAAIDLRTGLLPDPLVLAVAVTGLGGAILLAPETVGYRVIGGLLGAGVLAGVAFAFARLRGREGLGRGDIKLIGALGLWVGWQGLPWVILLGSLSGLAYAAVRLMLRRPIARDEELPFGPFLALAGWLVWLYSA